MIVTQTLADQVSQRAYCCLAKMGKEISDRFRHGMSAECQLSEYNLLQRYVKILSEYQWAPECTCDITGAWWAAAGYPGKLRFLGDGVVAWFVDAENIAYGTYTFSNSGSLTVDIEADFGTIDLTVFPTNGTSFFNESCTVFDGTSYTYIQAESTSASLTIPGKYTNPYITVEGVTIFSFSGILDVNDGPNFLTTFVTSFNNNMIVTGGEYQMILVNSTQIQINGPAEVEGGEVSFEYGFGSISDTFLGDVTSGFVEEQLVFSNCLLGEAIFVLDEEAIDFGQVIYIYMYSLAEEDYVEQITVPPSTVTSLEELVSYLNANLVPPVFTEFILDGTTLIVRSEEPSYVANPIVFSYVSGDIISATNPPLIVWNTDLILVYLGLDTVYSNPAGFATEAEFISDFNVTNTYGLTLSRSGPDLVFTQNGVDYFGETIQILLSDSVYFSAEFDSKTTNTINLTNDIVCIDAQPSVTCTTVYNCLTKADLSDIVKAVNKYCSLYNCH